MQRHAEIERKTRETQVQVRFDLDGEGSANIETGVAFFDHMLTLFSVHGFFDLKVRASGDLDVDCHHTVEDVGLVLGDSLDQALGARQGIHRYGAAVTPMDEAIASVAVDLSRRPFLVFRVPIPLGRGKDFDAQMAKQFFMAFVARAGITLHIDVPYGENEHHVIEAVFKAFGRALAAAAAPDPRSQGVRSSKGSL